MAQHEAINALPTGADADSALIRAMVTKRFAYCLDSTEDLQTFTLTDPEDGTRPLFVIQNCILFELDASDTTTAHDGTTCLVTNDSPGLRYKAIDIVFPYSILSVTTTAQPGSPTLGDAYLVPAAATGTDWAGRDGDLAVYTPRGWQFIIAPVGRLVYNEGDTSYYHKNAGGSWIQGFGTQALGSGAVYPSNMHGDAGKINFFVENQTTTAPPGSPTDGVEYIVGGSATGAWAGQDGKIARYENGDWTYYTPREGWRAWDKSLDNYYVYSGSAWQTGGGNVAIKRTIYDTAGVFTFNKDARSVLVDVHVVGGTGGANASGGTATAGGTSSFGAHCSATGSAAGSSNAETAGGSGSGGDVNKTGTGSRDVTFTADVSATPTTFHFVQPGIQATAFGAYVGVVNQPLSSQSSASGGPGYSRKKITAASLGTSETVTVGAAGAAGVSGTAGVAGLIVIDEWVLQ